MDFHALRHTFVSRLSEAGVHPRVAMALARHSDLSLTMKHYTDVSLLDLKGAVAKAAGGKVRDTRAKTAQVATGPADPCRRRKTQRRQLTTTSSG